MICNSFICTKLGQQLVGSLDGAPTFQSYMTTRSLWLVLLKIWLLTPFTNSCPNADQPATRDTLS